MTVSKSISTSRNPSSWDPQDDILLRHLKEVKKLGWKEISQYFQSRTPNACQFRWRRLKSGNLKNGKSIDSTEDISQPTNMPTIESLSPDVKTQNSMLISQDLAQIPTYSKSSSNMTTPSSDDPAGINNNVTSTHFLKPRSYSHTVQSRPRVPFSDLSMHGDDNKENLGLIPKVIIRSRRSSTVHQSQQQQPINYTSIMPVICPGMNSTLTTTKTGKKSFSTRSRRSSFNMPISSTSSRRSSIVIAPNSLSSLIRRESFNSNASRDSIINMRRGSLATHHNDFRQPTTMPHMFIDLPSKKCLSMHLCHSGIKTQPWSSEEDALLQSRIQKKLSFVELSILLPLRSEKEIQCRIDFLNNTPPTIVSPLDSPSRYVDDTAIEEDDGEENNIAPTPLLHPNIRDNTPVSTSSSNKEQSPVFSPKNNSPAISDNTTRSRSNTIANQGTDFLHCQHAETLIGNHNDNDTKCKNTQLPSLNTIFKDIL